MSARRDRPTRAGIRRRNRDALLDAAARVFAERGFRVATIDEVAAAAGLTKGAVYSHFADKHDLFARAIARRYEERHGAFVAIMSDASLAVEERAAAAAREFAASVGADADWALLFVEAWAEMMRDPGFGREVRRLSDDFRDAVSRFIAEQLALLGRSLPGGTEPIAEMIIASTHGFGIAHRLDPEHATADRFAAFMGLVTTGLVAQADPRPE